MLRQLAQAIKKNFESLCDPRRRHNRCPRRFRPEAAVDSKIGYVATAAFADNPCKNLQMCNGIRICSCCCHVVCSVPLLFIYVPIGFRMVSGWFSFRFLTFLKFVCNCFVTFPSGFAYVSIWFRSLFFKWSACCR